MEGGEGRGAECRVLGEEVRSRGRRTKETTGVIDEEAVSSHRGRRRAFESSKWRQLAEAERKACSKVSQ